MLDEAFANVTVLTVAHRLRSVMDYDQILVMQQGRLVERGTHAALLCANGTYARLWQRQADGGGDGADAFWRDGIPDYCSTSAVACDAPPPAPAPPPLCIDADMAANPDTGGLSGSTDQTLFSSSYGLTLVDDITDHESVTSDELPAVLWGKDAGGSSSKCKSNGATRVGLWVVYENGLEGYGVYDVTSSNWDAVMGTSEVTSSGFLAACGAPSYLYTETNLPMAWSSCSNSFSSNFDLDRNVQSGSNWRASSSGWSRARLRFYCSTSAVVCADSDGIPDAKESYTADKDSDGPPPPPPPAPSPCPDSNTNCPTWASRGECSTNPGYMLTSCRGSCDNCPSPPPPPSPPPSPPPPSTPPPPPSPPPSPFPASSSA